MNPIYFPFTYISEPVADALFSCFNKIVLYQPSGLHIPANIKRWAEKGFLHIRIPIKGDEEKLDAVLKDYKVWANLHQGEDIAFFKTQGNRIPFFDELSVSQIQADIKQKKQKNSADPLFDARIFLDIAQEFDRQNLEINHDLFLLNQMEKNLIKNLKGEDAAFDSEVTEFERLELNDPGDYMTSKRIQAWARLFQHDSEMSDLFVTSSRTVKEYLFDKAPEAKIIFRVDSIPVYKRCSEPSEKMDNWRDSLMKYIERLSKEDQIVPEDTFECNSFNEDRKLSHAKVSFTLYIIPAQDPCCFFNRYIQRGLSSTKEKKVGLKIRNTLIGVIGF
ncbi:MAG: hypothetical protein JW786_15075 [Desulfobacterales bacterium]|nr:hypothetical protein [Desulfobacterales bacterium]